MIFKNDATGGDLDGFIDGGSRLVGELHFQDTFRVDGSLEGKVHSQGNLVIGEQGRIDGDVHVANVFVSGELRGSIREKCVRIRSTTSSASKSPTATTAMRSGRYQSA